MSRLPGALTRRDRRAPATGTRAHRVVRRAAGLCLEYPDSAVLARVPLVRAALAEIPEAPGAAEVTEFARYLAEEDPLRAQQHHVEVFDLRARRALHLTWWSDGDTRRRGLSLAALKERYRAHGLHPGDSGELPDHLPAVLEYAALRPDDGAALLTEHRGAIELLRLALVTAGTPYALPLTAVCATLPGTSPSTEADARALLRRDTLAPADLAGPERVGVEPGPLPPGASA
ncbi:nitrate reductase molybdenum cofactor assembly chaperone [Streptomyces sp. RFCAC02]|uniref:nitrate reductase molybdenum cofactor assembly chaperone n=1 Tax=Streptomyces sp. RFCAC02 TaxID=2499143 RepID=UPI001021C953|nr:nitrate reductase molybdenum cofactor assembly chaperone [Streptomyces sp. RFCAC02]